MLCTVFSLLSVGLVVWTLHRNFGYWSSRLKWEAELSATVSFMHTPFKLQSQSTRQSFVYWTISVKITNATNSAGCIALCVRVQNHSCVSSKLCPVQ